MKTNNKFFTGLATGLLIGLALFSADNIFSSNDTGEFENVVNGQATQGINGDWIPVDQANEKIAAFKTDFIDKYNLPQETTLGGVIGKSNLSKITGMGASEQIKYRFFYQNKDGKDQIGLVFFKNEQKTEALITGDGAFCPVMCD